ncbi:MAG: RNA-splicing ligase RtcB [Planctomyces sp.]|nr:RNA-splicing ligase RtcB [Planctomyces sp.]
MNTTQLRKIGVPDHAVVAAIQAIQEIKASENGRDVNVKTLLGELVAEPTNFVDHEFCGKLARLLIEEPVSPKRETPAEYRTWGDDIDPGAHAQMRTACYLPMAHGAALMPDAHIGYGLPIGGVLALENAVAPYAVGVDIACRMKLSVLDVPPAELATNFERFRHAIEAGTRFGVGSTHEKPQDHAVLDADWNITRITREHKDKARKQLGTSGSGNHFVEFGQLTLDKRDDELGLDAGTYTALLSHSGSRGPGAAVCDTYSRMAQARLPRGCEEFGRLAWLSLDSEAGQEYWAAMNLMGDFAAANHDVIHRLVSKKLGGRIIAGVENHHNFAWKEVHFGKELIVHRKGATPAGKGVLGVIPGSMADPAFIVRGKGVPESYLSASHGAGRVMSRTKAREQFNFSNVRKELAAKGVRVISAGSDEVPGVYKNILDVMAAQADLVEAIARFDPKIVKMSDDGKAED